MACAELHDVLHVKVGHPAVGPVTVGQVTWVPAGFVLGCMQWYGQPWTMVDYGEKLRLTSTVMSTLRGEAETLEDELVEMRQCMLLHVAAGLLWATSHWR